MILEEKPSIDELMHYGTPRHSGRYPWGSGEDPYQHSGDFISRYQSLKKEGKTIVIVTHSMNQVKQFCDRAVWLYKGEVKMDGKVDDVLEEYLKVCG